MTDPRGTSRRTFLSTSAAVGGALAGGLGFVPAVHARGADEIKVGLIGCGGRGTGAVENICEAAGTSYNIKIHAMADAFEDRAKNCFESSKNNDKVKEKFDVAPDRVFTGLDAYLKVIECCDLVMLATPPGFRPQHIEATIKAGKNLFTEKPVAVDGTGIRKVLAAAEEAQAKKLSVVAGTQRRHQAPYIESLKMIHDGEIGELVTARVYWNQGNIWAVKRQDGWSDMEYEIRNWYHFTWLCGDHIVEQHVHNLDVANWAFGAHPVRAYGMGGQQVNRAPEFGESYDHFAVEYEYPNGQCIQSQCRQIAGTDANVSETIVGTKGTWTSNGYRFGGGAKGRIRAQGINPYVQEHIDLLDGIVNGKPLNELQQVAESTMTAILGRLSAYTGKSLTWEEALNAKLDTFPKDLDIKAKRPAPMVAMPGQYELS
jgi:predicted dehydrogenase